MTRTLIAAAAAAAVLITGAACEDLDQGADPQPRVTVHHNNGGGKSNNGGGDSSKADAPMETATQANARATAEDYLDGQSFSRSGLIDQLEFEGFSTKAATYGADAAGADWNAQAVETASDYLDMQAFSRSALRDQLEFEGFTPAQAAHGVSVAYR